MNAPPELSQDLIWQADGHLSEVAITALADDQRELLPAPAQQHVQECESCSERLGQAALRSLEVGQELAALYAETQPELVTSESTEKARQPVERRPLPKLALAAALFLAALGAVPATVDLAGSSGSLLADLFRGVPLILAAAVRLWRSLAADGAVALTVLSCVAAIVLLAVGVFIARRQPRQLAAKGGS